MAINIGIDLGTTFSAVAVTNSNGEPVIVKNSYDSKTTPSVIQFANGEVLVGEEAYDAFKAGEDGCATTFKRHMGNNDPCFYTDDNEYTAEQLSTILLTHLKKEAEQALNTSINEVVITVPAYFFSAERKATLRAAEAAGLKVKKLIDEPNAAALAYGLNNWRQNANILVYDLGGGTFDVSMVRMDGTGELRTVSTKGNHILGGKDWDKRLATLLLDKIADQTSPQTKHDTELATTVQGLAEGIKKKLSALETTKVSVTVPTFGKIAVNVSAAEFKEVTEDLLNQTGHLCQFVLNELNMSASDVTDVLLVGGSTRMPAVAEFLKNMFGKMPISHINPDEAVALGAAIQATKQDDTFAPLAIETVDGSKMVDLGNLMEHRPVLESVKIADLAELTVRETTAHAMGIIAVSEDKTHYYNEVIIPANHPRPVRLAKKFRFYTQENLDNTLELYVLQGAHRNPLECVIPSKYIITGIKHTKRGDVIGVVIRVQYSYDKNGVVRVQARQGEEDTDLPITEAAVPDDMTKYGRSIDQSSTDFALQQGAALNQGVVHKYKHITFSNVTWERYDNIEFHADGSQYNEPKEHVIASEKSIEFHGYNISAMDEGVHYTIDAHSNFEIECNIDTTGIRPHPGGHVNIVLGIIAAQLDESGGDILLAGKSVAKVGSKFKLKMAVTNGGYYEVYINDKLVGSKEDISTGDIKASFGFEHDSHHCPHLSHAYITDIEMVQGSEPEDEHAEPWD
ncbi:MAG: Hsp70 family protein [Defluviitaleaceae bacterium]|nr:Hsp70 family protein [Defluviitaleaceae bacterium]